MVTSSRDRAGGAERSDLGFRESGFTKDRIRIGAWPCR